jgi:hypothetical protein
MTTRKLFAMFPRAILRTHMRFLRIKHLTTIPAIMAEISFYVLCITRRRTSGRT